MNLPLLRQVNEIEPELFREQRAYHHRLKQNLFVVSAAQLAAIVAGGIVRFPSVLLHQLNTNDSTIHLDIHTKSWLGSTQGVAGVLACLVPSFMQYKGRKLTLILSCLTGIIGWIIVYFAQNAETLIVAELFQGLSSSTLIMVCMLTMSEMVHPKIRIPMMNLYAVNQQLGSSLVIFIGQYFYWKTVGMIECCIIISTLMISLLWPESPAWLAYKGEFDKCEAAFKWLRGTDTEAQRELTELLNARKEIMAEGIKRHPSKMNKDFTRSLWLMIMQKDFYLPCLHMFLLLYSIYWGGMMVVLIYGMDILTRITRSELTASMGVKVIYAITFFGNIIATALLKYCKNKTILLSGGIAVVFFLVFACIFSFLQDILVLPSDNHFCMYCMFGYTASFNLGAVASILSIAPELMPVKHRGLGGAMYVILLCFLHFSSLKLAPYLFISIKPWGTFLLFAMNVLIGMFLIWKHVPETKDRTLQEIEDYYNHGMFRKRNNDDTVLEKVNIKDSL